MRSSVETTSFKTSSTSMLTVASPSNGIEYLSADRRFRTRYPGPGCDQQWRRRRRFLFVRVACDSTFGRTWNKKRETWCDRDSRDVRSGPGALRSPFACPRASLISSTRESQCSTINRERLNRTRRSPDVNKRTSRSVRTTQSRFGRKPNRRQTQSKSNQNSSSLSCWSENNDGLGLRQ